jgi:hypothetical protein
MKPPMYVNTPMDFLGDAYRTSSPEVSYAEHYIRQYVHGTCLHDLADLDFFTAISLISVFCSECTSPPPQAYARP